MSYTKLILTGLKAALFYLAKKYAAELIFDEFIKAADKAADLSATDLDDNIVAKVKAEKKVILMFIAGEKKPLV